MEDAKYKGIQKNECEVTLNAKLIAKGWTLVRLGVQHFAEFNELAIMLKNTVIQHFLLQMLEGRLGVIKFTSTVDNRVFQRMYLPDPKQYPP